MKTKVSVLYYPPKITSPAGHIAIKIQCADSKGKYLSAMEILSASVLQQLIHGAMIASAAASTSHLISSCDAMMSVQQQQH